MEHHNIHGCNNSDELAESSNIAAAREFESANIFNNMPKKEMRKLMSELVKKKNYGENLSPYTVDEVNFYDFGPDELDTATVANMPKQNGDDGCYFFTRRKPVSLGCVNASRKAGGGKWVQNSGTELIELGEGDSKQVIGYQRFFEFKKGSDKTPWRLYEYEENSLLNDPVDKLKYDYVLCKLYEKRSRGARSRSTGKRKVEGGRSSPRKEERKKASCSNSEIYIDGHSEPLNAISNLPHPGHSFASNPENHMDYHQSTPLNASSDDLHYSSSPSFASTAGINISDHSQPLNAISYLQYPIPSFVSNPENYREYHQPTPLNVTADLHYSSPNFASTSGINISDHSQPLNAISYLQYPVPSFVSDPENYRDYHQPTPLNVISDLHYSSPSFASTPGINISDHSQPLNAISYLQYPVPSFVSDPENYRDYHQPTPLNVISDLHYSSPSFASTPGINTSDHSQPLSVISDLTYPSPASTPGIFAQLPAINEDLYFVDMDNPGKTRH